MQQIQVAIAERIEGAEPVVKTQIDSGDRV